MNKRLRLLIVLGFALLASLAIAVPAFAIQDKGTYYRDSDGWSIQTYREDPHHIYPMGSTVYWWRPTSGLYKYPEGCWHYRGDPYSQCTWRPAGKYYSEKGWDAEGRFNLTMMAWYGAGEDDWDRVYCHEQAHYDGWQHGEGSPDPTAPDANCAYYGGGAFYEPVIQPCCDGIPPYRVEDGWVDPNPDPKAK